MSIVAERSTLDWWDVPALPNGLTLTDMFCGAGGSSTGLALAGYELRVALNHWKRAIETHETNFFGVDHRCEDTSTIDMRSLPRTDVLWASPICTEASPAGRKTKRRKKAPTRGQQDLLQHGPIEQVGFERTRATFYDVMRAAEVHRYEAVLIENVPEVASEWELFDWWVDGMKLLGYQVQFVSASSAHIGDDTNEPAPQWRNRLYLVFTKRGAPLPNVDPRPRAWCPGCCEDVDAVQWWKKPGRHIGKYRVQYLYRCPNRACKHAIVEPYVRGAIDIVDWSDLGTPIGKDRLVAASQARVAAGLRMVAADPEPFVTVMRRNATADRITEPLATLTAGGRHHALTVPPGAFYVKNYGGNARPQNMAKPVSSPLGTITAKDHHALVVPYRRGEKPHPVTGPTTAFATKTQHGLVNTISPEDIEACLYRVFKSSEHLLGQRFPRRYVVTGNEGERTMQAGNAVSSNVAQWLGARVAEALCGGQPDRDPVEVAA